MGGGGLELWYQGGDLNLGGDLIFYERPVNPNDVMYSENDFYIQQEIHIYIQQFEIYVQ